MKLLVLCIFALTVLCHPISLHSLPQKGDDASSEQPIPSMPSAEEVNDLLSKASEYVVSYQKTFKDAQPVLSESPQAGFTEKSDQLCSQANSLITSIRKNGPSAYGLVGLIAVLDDMSLNAARASSMAIIVAMQHTRPDSDHRAIQDVQDLAQAGKNCYDISELILHPTLRLIAVEERVLLSASQRTGK